MQADTGSRVCPQRVSELGLLFCSWELHPGSNPDPSYNWGNIEGNVQDITTFWQMSRFCLIYGHLRRFAGQLITVSSHHVCGNSIAEGWRGVSGSSACQLSKSCARQTCFISTASIRNQTQEAWAREDYSVIFHILAYCKAEYFHLISETGQGCTESRLNHPQRSFEPALCAEDGEFHFWLITLR